MMGKTHTAIGMTAAAVLASNKILENPKNIVPIITITTIASLLPDIDKKGSTISNKLNRLVFNILIYLIIILFIAYKTTYIINISSIVKQIQINPQILIGIIVMAILLIYSKLTEHRSFTHSILGVVLYTLAFALINKEMLQYFMLGYILHLAADFFTDKGIELIYPIRKRFNFHLISTNSVFEYLIRYGCYALLFLTIYKPINF